MFEYVRVIWVISVVYFGQLVKIPSFTDHAYSTT